MDDIEIDEVATPELDDPVLIEGLPGVGHVGKLAAEHLLEEFDGELVRRVYATEFPPQVSVEGEDGVASLTCAEFHAVETGRLRPARVDRDHKPDRTRPLPSHVHVSRHRRVVRRGASVRARRRADR